MNPTAMSLAQTRFHAALNLGTSTAPIALSQLLEHLSTDSLVHPFDAEAVGHSTGDEFPFLRNMTVSGTPPDNAASAAWEAAVRWVLSALRNWRSDQVNSLNKLRALLSTVTALDAHLAGLSSVAPQIASRQLTAGLQRLIESTDVAPGFDERRFHELRQQIEGLADSGNLERLGQMVPRMNFFPASDFWTAVVFTFNADPAALADVVEKRNNALFSIMVCTVLGTHAIAFASRVDNLVFKFVSVANFWQGAGTAEPPQSSQSTLQALLLQVARTSATEWAAWMRALFKHPGNNAALDAALGAVLQQLHQDHWMAFFRALSLAYSRRAAAPVANMLIPFARSAEPAQRDLMWSTAYQVWSDWNYGERDTQGAMFAPVACALDFPVAMYYACQPAPQVIAEERRLASAIGSVEERWFDTVTDLITERNRLKSRLRLVQHGIALASGGTQALPPPIQADADLYATARYHYYELD